MEQVRFLKDEQKTQIAYTEPEENHSTHNTPQLNVSFEKNKKMLAKSKTMLPNSPKSLGNSSIAQSRNPKLNNQTQKYWIGESEVQHDNNIKQLFNKRAPDHRVVKHSKHDQQSVLGLESSHSSRERATSVEYVDDKERCSCGKERGNRQQAGINQNEISFSQRDEDGRLRKRSEIEEKNDDQYEFLNIQISKQGDLDHSRRVTGGTQNLQTSISNANSIFNEVMSNRTDIEHEEFIKKASVDFDGRNKMAQSRPWSRLMELGQEGMRCMSNLEKIPQNMKLNMSKKQMKKMKMQ